MHLQESGEMYLETIYILSQNLKNVRSIDIAEYMSFSKPAISRAMKTLKKNGYIFIDDKGYITLLPPGNEIATKIYERHTLLTDFLIKLGVDEKTAAEDACKIEHDISDKSFDALKNMYKKNIVL